ncbi:glycosyltransferase family 2 protein [Nostoc sp. TCL26-01]|uniref:glycosyltransferase n=1 Tax=Nostoc sp. TCL26-01 TaxID=2576904 RepID=UPI0015BEE877|nr:glycosyltransferase family 2 protein [Nostoc sp. TCL26-01]QLE59073.1 glycosyltransferase family 2 protein [Nostoc sp. TCL26-01]
MDDLAILISKFLVGWLIFQVCCVLLFLRCLNSRTNNLPDELLPKTAVLLCLRGADPFLGDCLRSLLKQNYPRYDLKVIVDSQQDPAWQVVRGIIDELDAANVQVSHLRTVRQSCSLKCSSLIQAVSDLDDSYKVVALVDADTVVHTNWLRELVSPLNYPQVGATTGNRWYLPTGRYWGSLVRYIWNVSAIVQMYLYGIPWGGTLAIKTEVLRQTGLLERWGQAFGEDTVMRSVLAKYNLEVKFVPSLIMLNREECDLPSLRYWLQRQLLSSRLYHPWWWLVVADAVCTILLPSFLIVVWFTAFLSGQGETATFAFSWYVIYILALVMLMLFLELGVQPIIRSHGQQVTKLSAPLIWRMIVSMPLTHWVYGWAMLAALRMQTVTWRGVTYEVNSTGNIQLMEYRPYQSVNQIGDR